MLKLRLSSLYYEFATRLPPPGASLARRRAGPVGALRLLDGPEGRLEVEASLVELGQDDVDTPLHGVLIRPQVHLGLLRAVVGRIQAGKVLDDALPSLLVEALGVSLLDDIEGRVYEDLKERERRIFVQLTRELPVRSVRRDEADDRDRPRLRKEL